MSLAARHQVRLKNQSGSYVAIFDDWRSLQFKASVNKPGFFTFSIDGNDDRAGLFEVDGQIEFWRAIPGVLDWRNEFEAHIENFDRTLFSSGNYQFMVVGSGYKATLSRRIIAYYDGASQAAKNDAAETVMKEYVDENIGPGATMPPRLGASGVMAGFSIQADAGAGSTWTGDRAGKNLLQVLQEIANFSSIDFDVVGTGDATYEFRTYEGQLGQDKTTDGLDPATGRNGAGNVPHIFGPAPQDNVQEIRYVLRHRKEANAVYIYGPGSGATRLINEQEDAASIALSPIARREVMRGGGSQSQSSELDDIASEWLEKLQYSEIFTFEPRDTNASLYGVHYDLGDKVTARLGDIERNKRITDVLFTVSSGGGGETKKITFADIP